MYASSRYAFDVRIIRVQRNLARRLRLRILEWRRCVRMAFHTHIAILVQIHPRH
jgi:hypothetical protein